MSIKSFDTSRPDWKHIMLSPNIPFAHNRLLQLMILCFALFWGYMAVSPVDWMAWAAENAVTFAALLVLVFTYRTFRFTNFSYLLMLMFLLLHTYATHYTYAGTPFDTWLHTSFGTTRSYYDRLVHLSFGLLWVYPFRELLVRAAHLRGWWTYALPLVVIISLNASFEILEMVAAMVAGEGGEGEFVGLQGDIFDTHKDMALGFVGAALALGLDRWLEWRAER